MTLRNRPTDFDNVVAIFVKALSPTLIYPIEVLLPLLGHESFADHDIVLLAHKGHTSNTITIFPSLSLYRKAGGKPAIARELSTLTTECLQTVPPLDEYRPQDEYQSKTLYRWLCKAFAAAEYAVHPFISDHATIFVRGNSWDLEPHLRLLASAFRETRDSTLNLLNESRKMAHQDLKLLYAEYRPSLKATLFNLQRFVRTRYGLSSCLFERKTSASAWETVKRSGRQLLDAQAMLEQHKECISETKPTIFLISNVHCLFFPVVDEHNKRNLYYLLLLFSKETISRYIVHNLHDALAQYYRSYLEIQKRKLLRDMQDRILKLLDHPVDQGFRDTFNYLDKLRTFAAAAFRSVIQLTNAFSATIRLHNPVTQALELLVDITGQRTSRTVDKKTVYSISIPESPHSVNVQTFLNSKRDSYNYQRNLDGSSRALIYRHGLASELCLPLYFKNVRIGVMNFESPVVDGFGQEDRDFLNHIRQQTENYASLLIDVNDKHWLAERSQVYLNLHELNHAALLAPPNIREAIRHYTEKRSVYFARGYARLTDLQHSINEYFDRIRQMHSGLGAALYQDAFEPMARGVKCEFVDPRYVVTAHKMSMLKIVLQDLLDNYRKYSTDRDTFLLMQRKQDHNLLNIRIYTHSSRLGRLFPQPSTAEPSPELNIGNLTLTPLRDAASKGHMKYGMFIVGMLSRHMGGFSYVMRNHLKKRFEFIITIPLK